jgi:hypothetical protein
MSWLTDMPAAFVANSSKVCVLLMEGVYDDVAETSSPSKRTLVAPETLHLSVQCSSVVIVVALALKESMDGLGSESNGILGASISIVLGGPSFL